MDEKRLVDGATALAEKQSRVIKIEPAERPQNVRLRVAAYTRVSSDSEDQLNSFAAQNRYYTELISSKAEWRMVDIYADEGITGTSVTKRDDFQRMMADCRRGLIDQILVKSISRFARNTKDCLQNICELKELGVNVRFEREGIDTVNVSSELITAIYAAFAQKESESISGNMRWSYQHRMESGEFNSISQLLPILLAPLMTLTPCEMSPSTMNIVLLIGVDSKVSASTVFSLLFIDFSPL